jgi:branched-chain amino acid transport system substrate-binding protein
MQRPNLLAAAATAAIVHLVAPAPGHAQQVMKIGAVAPKTGPLGGGAAVTHWPNVQLWVNQVNARGGLKLATGPQRIQVIEYDDQTQPGETIKAVERLATQDKVDFILQPYSTGLNLAAAPTFAKYDYPQIATTAVTDQIGPMAQRFPGLFFVLGDTSSYARSVVDILSAMRAEGKVGNKVAMVNVADAFGIELANVARPLFKSAGFDLVYDRSYPLGTQDLAPVVKAAKAANPDAFIAWSYPVDTFILTEQAKIEAFNVKVFYVAVASAFPGFLEKFGKSAEGIMGAGGINHDAPETQAYVKAHREITGKAPDNWASIATYAGFEILGQAIEAVGSKDRKKVSQYIKDTYFNTAMGPIKFEKQNNEKFWTVGQWQNGVFYGVRSTGRPGEKPVIAKPAW